jgi:hypothetical protein
MCPTRARSGLLHKQSGKILAIVDEKDDPEYGADDAGLPSHVQKKEVEQQDVDNDWTKNRKRKRDVAVDQQECAADHLDAAHDLNIVGLEHCTRELACEPRRQFGGEKVQEGIQAEEDKDGAQQDAGDDGHDFHECSLTVSMTHAGWRVTIFLSPTPPHFGAAIADQDARCTNIPEKYLR